MTYQQKLRQAAKSWMMLNPNSGKTEVQVSATIAKNNARHKQPDACNDFDYSGTIWCDRCGHEDSVHYANLIKHYCNEGKFVLALSYLEAAQAHNVLHRMEFAVQETM